MFRELNKSHSPYWFFLFKPVLWVPHEMMSTANAIDAGDPMHPLATNEFSKQIKRVSHVVFSA